MTSNVENKLVMDKTGLNYRNELTLNIKLPTPKSEKTIQMEKIKQRMRKKLENKKK